MKVLSAAVLALLRAESKQRACLFTLDTAGTDYHWTTWPTPITHDAVTYEPKVLRAPAFEQAAPGEASWAVAVADADGAIDADWYDNNADWASALLEFQLVLRYHGERDWTTVFEVSWARTTCKSDPQTGWFVINTLGSAGLRLLAGLILASRTLFPYAPDPSQPFQIGNTGFRFEGGPRTHAPPPGGYNPPWTNPALMQPLEEIAGDGLPAPRGGGGRNPGGDAIREEIQRTGLHGG